MKLSFLTSLFTKDKKSLTLPDSILLKKLKKISHEHSFFLFDNVTIFHHTLNYHFPLIILDETRGLYIFEKKEWSYNDLKNATVEKAQHQETSQDTLSFQNKQDIINQKFNELTHHSDVPIFNYLLMENLNADEYEHLHDSFKELIPINKVVFNDSDEKEILQKLHNSPKSLHPLPSKDYILGNLLIQYTVLDNQQNVKLCTQEQIDIINHDIFGLESLQASAYSGKTSILLLKAIMHVLTHKGSQVLIIKPTLLACDLLKKKLLEIIEHAIIEFNILDILIVTPDEFLQMKKAQIPKLIVCDDANLLLNDFIHQLIEIQKNANLLLVNYKTAGYSHTLTKEFTSVHKDIKFHHTHKLAKTLLLIAKLLKNADAQDIFIMSNEETRIKLQDDLQFFIAEETTFLDATKHLVIEDLNAIVFLDLKSIDELNPKHLIILDATQRDTKYIEQSIDKTSTSVDIIYETQTEYLTTLKDKYESNKK